MRQLLSDQSDSTSHIESRVRRILGLVGDVSPRTGRLPGLSVTVIVAGMIAYMALITLQPGDAEASERKTALAAPLSGITIDGRLDDWPGGLPVYKIREIAATYGPTDVDGTDLDNSTDLSPEFRVGYSLKEQVIYVAIRVRDDRIRVGGWSVNTDACEVYLGRGSLPFQYVLCPEGGSYRGGSNPTLIHDELGNDLSIDVTRSRGAFGRVGDVTVYEWALELLGTSLEHYLPLDRGMVIDFDVVAVDKDTEDGNPAYVSWNMIPPRGASKLRDPDLQGKLVLVKSIADLPDVTVLSEPATGSIKGQILREEDGRRFGHAMVELRRDTLVHRFDTGADGSFQLSKLPGVYTITASGRGSLPETFELQVKIGEEVAVSLSLADRGTLFHADPDTPQDKVADGGYGAASRPFQTIQEGLDVASYGDTIRLAPGTYRQPAELISGVTLIGSGENETRVIGEAHFGLAIRPFISYYQPPGAETEMSTVTLRDVVMKDFTFDGGEEYPPRSAEDVSDLLALVMAANRRDVASVEALLARNPGLATARILSPDAYSDGSTLLHSIVSVYTSASDEKYEIARLLIEHGADVNAEGGQARGAGESALGYAGFFGDVRLVELYLDYGADPNRVSSTGLTPVGATAHEGSHARRYRTYLPSFEALVKAGGSYDLGHLIMLNHTERLVAELDKHPDKVNDQIKLRHERDEYGTPLHEAADDCRSEVAAMLLDRGADLNALDNKGQTALQRAIKRNRDECRGVIEILRAHGAGAR